MGDENGNNMEDTSGCKTSGVWLARLGIENVVSMVLLTRSEVSLATWGIVNQPTYEMLGSCSVSRSRTLSALITTFLILVSTITYEHNVKSSLSISPYHNHESTPSSAVTEACTQGLLQTPSTASSQNRCLPIPATLSAVISWRTLLYCTLYIPTVTS